MTTNARSKRIAWQRLETERLMGVDVVPRRDAPSPGVAAEAATVEPTEKQQRLDELRRRHDESCPHCTASTTHTQTVFGEGNADAELMFVGEAPGAEEDRTGRPFVGRAGKKLEEMIEAMGRRREDVYIANVLKTRPPNNRTPQRDEVDHCAPFLAEQIRIIAPRVIVALGGPASKFLLQTDTGITRIRGQWAACRFEDLDVDVMPTFHPAYLLRNYTRETRERVWSDLCAVNDRLQGTP